MAVRTILAAGAACLVVGGVAVAGSLAGAASAAPALSGVPAGADQMALASAVVGASGDGTTPATGDARALAARRDMLCARVPDAIIRTRNLEKRLAADASTQGSLAWLQTKIDKAKAQNQDQLVTVLENRLAFRKELAQFLPQRLDLLQKAQQTVCAPAPTAGSSSS